jgi:hypothetical protein
MRDRDAGKGLSRFAFRHLSEKQKNQKLCALCASNERSEWAVKNMHSNPWPLEPLAQTD